MSEEREENNNEEITMKELYQRQLELEEEAAIQLSETQWGDENTCTFNRGYIRQPVFACLTCGIQKGRPIGVCFGCSLNCHVNHEIVELFWKHSFRCDCCSCELETTTTTTTNRENVINDKNRYGHNFQGKFCVCGKGYNAKIDVMFQCICCEDWFHDHCITEVKPVEGDGDDFICTKCSALLCSIISRYPTTQAGNNEPLIPVKTCPQPEPNNSNLATTTTTNSPQKAMLLRSGWQNILCRCEKCSKEYESFNWPWIFETIPEIPEPKEEEEEEEEPQKQAKEQSNTTTTETKTINVIQEMTETELAASQAFLTTVPRVQAVELLSGYERMAAGLKEYLHNRTNEGAVTAEEIKEYMELFKQQEKRRRV